MRRHRTTGGVQMFSFLDAMVCTMGALLVLVHAFARHGQEQVIKSPELKAARENLDTLTGEVETLEWRTAQLKETRDKTHVQLDDERLKLSHVEDHQRRLLARLDELKIGADEMARRGAVADTAQHAAADLKAVQTRLQASRDALAKARKAAQEGAVDYSVVPYEGPNSTHRRPVYIECRREAIVIQPEGVELTEDEFAGYLGPGNPLAAAVRGMREYWARQTPGGTPTTEPYPLLLVRPEGIKSYYAARAALDSWGSDFGYELVGADWNLKFPDPDEQLAQLTREIVADAAVRARALVVSLAQLSKNRPRAALHASPHGGFVADRSRSAGDGSRGMGGRGAGFDSIGSNWASDGDGSEGGVEDAAGNSAGGDTARGANNSDRPGGYARGTTGTDGGGGGGGSEGLADGTESRASGGDSDRYGQQQSSGRYADTSGRPYGGQYSGQSSGKDGGQSGSAKSGSAQGQGSAGGEKSYASGERSSSGGSSSSSSSAAGSQSGDDAQSMAGVGMPSPSLNATAKSKKTEKLAKTRGRDWGLPDGGSGAAAATRPTLVECRNDRLVLLSEDRGHAATEVRLGPHAKDSMDEFVGHVWQHMKSWGTAGKGLYWRPTLVMEVEQGAADRYAEVKSLLADSGLDVQERRPKTAQQPNSTSSRPFRAK